MYTWNEFRVERKVNVFRFFADVKKCIFCHDKSIREILPAGSRKYIINFKHFLHTI